MSSRWWRGKKDEFGIPVAPVDWLTSRAALKRTFIDPQKIEACDRKGAKFKMGDTVKVTGVATGYEFPYGRFRPRHAYDIRGRLGKIVGKEGGFYIVRTSDEKVPPGEAYSDFWAKPKAIERVCRP